MAEFSFTDQEFLSVINMIVKLDAPLGEEYIPLKSMDERIDMGRLDSLSIIVFFVWLSHMFGIPEPKLQDFIKKENLTIQSIKVRGLNPSKRGISLFNKLAFVLNITSITP